MHQVRKEEAFKCCLDTRSKAALPLDPPFAERLSVRSPAVLPYITNFGKWKKRKERKPCPEWRLSIPMKSLLLSSSCFFPFTKALRFFVFPCMCCVVAAIALDPSLKQIWSHCSRHGQDDGSGTQLILRPSVCVRLRSLSDKPFFKGMHKNSNNNNNRRQQGCATTTTAAECAHIATVIAERRSEIESAC